MIESYLSWKGVFLNFFSKNKKVIFYNLVIKKFQFNRAKILDNCLESNFEEFEALLFKNGQEKLKVVPQEDHFLLGEWE